MPSTLKQVVDRVKATRTEIANAITAKGGTVGANDGLEDFASDIGTIANWLKTPTLGRCIPTCSKFKGIKTWTTKTWTGLNPSGSYIWTDGENIYSSSSSKQYVLDKSTSTWTAKVWTGRTSFDGYNIWTDGENIYYSYASTQSILDKSTSTWTTKTWSGLTDFNGQDIWTDGEYIYYSGSTGQYVLDKSTSTWNSKTWSGLTNFNGRYIWTDGENIYYSNDMSHYILDKSTSTWTAKTAWNLQLYGDCIWTDGENIYYSYSSSNQRIFNKPTSSWFNKSWSGVTNFKGSNVWSDGENIYGTGYYSSDQYVLENGSIYDSTVPTTPTCRMITSV